MVEIREGLSVLSYTLTQGKEDERKKKEKEREEGVGGNKCKEDVEQGSKKTVSEGTEHKMKNNSEELMAVTVGRERTGENKELTDQSSMESKTDCVTDGGIGGISVITGGRKQSYDEEKEVKVGSNEEMVKIGPSEKTIRPESFADTDMVKVESIEKWDEVTDKSREEKETLKYQARKEIVRPEPTKENYIKNIVYL